MSKTITILIASLLLACASPMDLAQKPPVLEFDSAKSPKDVATCLGPKWSEHLGNVSTVLIENGYMISIMNQVAGTDATAVITEKAGGSHVRYAERAPSLSPAWMKDAVVGCQ